MASGRVDFSSPGFQYCLSGGWSNSHSKSMVYQFVNSMMYLLLRYKDVVSSSQVGNIYNMCLVAVKYLVFNVCCVGGVTYIQNQESDCLLTG